MKKLAFLPVFLAALFITAIFFLQSPAILHTEVLADIVDPNPKDPPPADNKTPACIPEHTTCSPAAKCCDGLSCVALKCEKPGANLKDTNKDKKAKEKPIPVPKPPCEKYGDKGKCDSVSTALGSISTEPGAFIQRIFAFLLGISGGIALLLIIKAGYQIMTSQGKPEGLQQGRDQLIAAIVGLLFLIFSFVLLQTIGVDILHLPGLQ